MMVYESKKCVCSVLDVQPMVQSKPVYSNHFFAAENGKNKPIVRKKPMKINTKCDLFTDQGNKLVRKNR